MRFPKLSKDTFRLAQDSAILVNAAAFSGFLFLLVHPLLGRWMRAVDYAAFLQVMALLTVLGVPANAVQVAVSRYVAEFAHGNLISLWVTVVHRAARRLAWCGGVGLIGWFVLCPSMADLLHVGSVTSLAIVGVAAVISLFLPLVFGTLQGAMWFRWFAVAALSLGVFRLLFCSVAVLTHNSVPSALLGVTVSILAGLLVGYWPFRQLMAGTSILPDFDTRPVYRYLWPVLGGQAAVFLLISADMILSKRLLPPDEFGTYGKVAMLSRTVLFIAQPIAIAMFPRAVNSARLRVLLVPLAAAFGITLTGAVALSIMPNLPMRLMYGVDDPIFDALTRSYVWAMLPHAMVMFIAQYLWARHQIYRVLFLVPIVLAYVAALWRTAQTSEEIILFLAGAGWLALGVLLAGVLVRRTPGHAEVQS